MKTLPALGGLPRDTAKRNTRTTCLSDARNPANSANQLSQLKLEYAKSITFAANSTKTFSKSIIININFRKILFLNFLKLLVVQIFLILSMILTMQLGLVLIILFKPVIKNP